MQLLCSVDLLAENSAKGFQVENTSIVVIKKNQTIYTYLNQCPHRGIALEWLPDQFLDSEKNFIQCATHGALFTIENGECIAGPCPGEKLLIIHNEIRDGSIWITLPTQIKD